MYRELGCNLRTESKQVNQRKSDLQGRYFSGKFWMEELVVTHFVTTNSVRQYRAVGKRVTGDNFPPQIREQKSGPDLHEFTLKFLALKNCYFFHFFEVQKIF